MKQKPLKILHLLSQRPDSTGSGIYLQAMLREAEARGHHNYLLAGIQSGRPALIECVPDDRHDFVCFGKDVSFSIVGMSDAMPYSSTRFCDLTAEDLQEYHQGFEKKLKHAVSTFGPDIIHSHHLWLLSSLAKRLFAKTPVVTTCHGSDLRQFQNCSHLQQTVLSGCSRIDAVMALSLAQKAEIIRLYRLPAEKIHVVGAGFNDTLFQPGNKPQPEPVQLVYAGKLSRAKGVPWLLEVLFEIDKPPWQLHLVGSGSGEQKEACLNLAKRLGEKRVQVHGAVTQQKLAVMMQRSHVFILPSFYEGLPLVLLEALASGCRVIANDLPGVVELLGNIETDCIRLVKTPRLHLIDRPFPEDEKDYKNDLAHAIRNQLADTIRQPAYHVPEINQRLAGMSWAGVFGRVERVYFQTLQST